VTRGILASLLLAAAAPAWAQESDDYQRLMRAYIETFRILGRSRICKLDFDAEPHFREVARRHGEQSEPLAIARLAYAAGAENLMLDRKLEPAPRAPMPCDVMVYMKGMGLPPLPASLAR
jgi:hypothetical protein